MTCPTCGHESPSHILAGTTYTWRVEFEGIPNTFSTRLEAAKWRELCPGPTKLVKRSTDYREETLA